MTSIPVTGRRGSRICVALLLLALSSSVYTNLWLRNLLYAELDVTLHEQVLEGTAESPYQYQMYLHEKILERLWDAMPRRSAASFAAAATLYYGVGLALFVLLLYRLCLRFGRPETALLASLYFIAILSIFWYDNYHHPGDPWGALLAVLLVERALDERRGWHYFGLLLLSGFVWEKHVFLPLSVAVAELLSPTRSRRLLSIGIETGAATAVAALGQVAMRLLFGVVRPWSGAAIGNQEFVTYLWGLLVVFGLPIVFLLAHPRRTPLVIRTLCAQLPLWLVIYLASGGVLKEMRGILIMVPYSWPALVLALETWLPEPRRTTGAGPSTSAPE